MIRKRVLYLLLLAFIVLYFLQKKSVVFVWQNYTSNHKTILSVLLPEDKDVTYWINKQKVFPSFQKSLNKWKIHHLEVKNLNSNKVHELEIIDSKTSYKKEFKTLNWNKNSFTIAVASCMDDRWNKRQMNNMWENLLSFEPDVIFLIGDNVYADKYVSHVSPSELEKRYIETFTTLPVYQTPSLIPILSIWDDHDYGMNNGDGSFEHKTFMTKLFRDFFPLPEQASHLQKGPGISFLIQNQNQNIFFMDGRSDRSAHSLWGDSQEKWLFKHFYQKPLNWIVSGGQFFGKHHKFESFEKDFPENFKKVMKKVSKSKKDTLVISGDRHLSELLHASPIYEFTTSPIHAKIYPQAKDFVKTDRHIHHISNQLNFGIIHHQIKNRKFITQVQLYGPDKILIFSEKID